MTPAGYPGGHLGRLGLLGLWLALGPATGCQLITQMFTARAELGQLQHPVPVVAHGTVAIDDDLARQAEGMRRALQTRGVEVTELDQDADGRCDRVIAVWGTRDRSHRILWLADAMVYVFEQTRYADGSRLEVLEAHRNEALGGWQIVERVAWSYPGIDQPVQEFRQWIRDHGRWSLITQYDDDGDSQIDWREQIHTDTDAGMMRRTQSIDSNANGRIDFVIEEWVNSDEQLQRRRKQALAGRKTLPWSTLELRWLGDVDRPKIPPDTTPTQ